MTFHGIESERKGKKTDERDSEIFHMNISTKYRKQPYVFDPEDEKTRFKCW